MCGLVYSFLDSFIHHSFILHCLPQVYIYFFFSGIHLILVPGTMYNIMERVEGKLSQGYCAQVLTVPSKRRQMGQQVVVI